MTFNMRPRRMMTSSPTGRQDRLGCKICWISCGCARRGATDVRLFVREERTERSMEASRLAGVGSNVTAMSRGASRANWRTSASSLRHRTYGSSSAPLTSTPYLMFRDLQRLTSCLPSRGRQQGQRTPARHRFGQSNACPAYADTRCAGAQRPTIRKGHQLFSVDLTGAGDDTAFSCVA